MYSKISVDSLPFEGMENAGMEVWERSDRKSRVSADY